MVIVVVALLSIAASFLVLPRVVHALDNKRGPSAHQEGEDSASNSPSSNSEDPLRLPPISSQSDTQKVDLSSGSASLADALGPLVINSDGTTSRIANWQMMTPAEKATTLRIITARNRKRMAKLKDEL
ncbi:hypothetical protein BWQ96_02703 [Gracilariopsis chorda]|uniref:Uncharacterized protein n=1 Tax=Gracilariopsis chorda TaxID=448386 RepID=A0A2V3IZN5_9FLOR|nr:hypothetical protein BWQ96_02703 [Gracilariopsis chorda]|eukprot:PXF47559.1 hypothetical protein BWQ96_02703 [Gracilariopsis chorda]